MKLTISTLAVLVLLAAVAALVGYSGLYNVAADEPHWALSERVLEGARARSIAVRARELAVPELADEKRILVGAGQYAEMCQSCHLAPGIGQTPLRQGLYPKPPELAQHRMDPRETFWVLKHGIKMTGMPAWGASHDDDTLWSIVAFLQKLPQLDAKAYRDLVERAPPDEEMKEHPASMHGEASKPVPHSHGGALQRHGD